MAWVPKVLCVDDEPNVLHGLRRSLRGRFEVHTAQNGVDGLRMLGALDVAVICSDMRMPGMDGAAFLSAARDVAPEATRVLLSGQADLHSLERVINGSGVHRFLVKPCERADLLRALTAAAEEHRLRRSERELLEGTVAGSLQLASEVLSLAAPLAAQQGSEAQRLVEAIARHTGHRLTWEERTTAALACLGMVALPPDLLQRLASRRTLSADETAQLEEGPELAAGLVRHLPRLSGVAEHLEALGAVPGTEAPWVVRALYVVLCFLRAPASPHGDRGVLARLPSHLDREMVRALWEVKAGDGRRMMVVRSAQLQLGMELVEPVYTVKGVLLMPGGLVLQEASLAKLRNFGLRYGIQEPIRVRVPLEDLSEDGELIEVAG
jgi:CheY-like chemotaxis protein